jgi:hypothetical protein
MDDDEEYCGWFIDWIEQYSQFFRQDNWYTYNPVVIEFEDDRCMGGAEITLIVLGLGFRLRWNYEETEQVKEIIKQMDEL